MVETHDSQKLTQPTNQKTSNQRNRTNTKSNDRAFSSAVQKLKLINLLGAYYVCDTGKKKHFKEITSLGSHTNSVENVLLKLIYHVYRQKH